MNIPDLIIRHKHLDIRDATLAIEKVMKRFPQLEMKVIHKFANGMYCRELIIPKDAVIVGKIHKYDHFVIISKGDLSFTIDDQVKRVKAPFVEKSRAGAKRIIFAHEDSVMITVHQYDGGIDEADDYLVFEKEDDWLEFKKLQPVLALE